MEHLGLDPLHYRVSIQAYSNHPLHSHSHLSYFDSSILTFRAPSWIGDLFTLIDRSRNILSPSLIMEDDDDDLYGGESTADGQNGLAGHHAQPSNGNQGEGEEGEAMEDESDDEYESDSDDVRLGHTIRFS